MVLSKCEFECEHVTHRIVTTLTNQPSSDCERPREDEIQCDADLYMGEDRENT